MKIIVVGTGIVGAVTSYQLARRGVYVTMIDSAEDGRATNAAAGMINPWTSKRRNQAWYTLANKGALFYEQLMNELKEDGETDFGYKKVGSIHLHDDEDKLNKLYKIVQKRKIEEKAIGNIDILDEEETYKQFPYTNKNYKGLFISGTGRVNGQLLANSLINAAQKQGAKKILGRAELIQNYDEVTGVKVGRDLFEADATIVTNGIWMPQLLKQIGLQMNVTIRKGEIIHLKTNEFTDNLPAIIPPSNKYMLPFENGQITIGTTFTREEFEKKSTGVMLDSVYEIMHETLLVAPKLKSATIAQMKTGFRPYTANSLPLFGPVPTVPRLYAANGLGASGLSTGPMIGLQLAKLMTNEPLDFQLEHYSLDQAIQ